jgi:hypothetical protein
MSARYHKLDVRLWMDEKFRALSRNARYLFIFLLTCPEQTMLGAMRATVPGLACEAQMSEAEFRSAVKEIEERGMVKIDETAGLVWLPNWLRYHRPESPSVVKHWPTVLDLLPECRLKSEIVKKAKVFIGGLPANWRHSAFISSSSSSSSSREKEKEKENTAHVFTSQKKPSRSNGHSRSGGAIRNSQAIDYTKGARHIVEG